MCVLGDIIRSVVASKMVSSSDMCGMQMWIQGNNVRKRYKVKILGQNCFKMDIKHENGIRHRPNQKPE